MRVRGLMWVCGHVCPCEQEQTTAPAIPSQAPITHNHHVSFMTVNEKGALTCNMLIKMRKGQRERKCGRPSSTIHIYAALNDTPIQLNTCAYVANSLKSSILNLYDLGPHKLHQKYISLGKLAGGSDTDFIKSRPYP